MQAVVFGFCGGIVYELGVDDHATVFGGFGGHALRGESWAEDGNQGWCDVGAEGCTYCEGAGVGHPVALRCECTSCDAVGDLLKARIQVEHFCWGCLGVFAAFEEWGDANEADIIIPHHDVILLVSRNFKSVLEDFETLSTCLLQEAFLLAVIRNMAGVFLDLAKGMNLEFFDLAYGLLIQTLKWREIDLSLDLTLDKNSAVLSHLLLLDHRLS